MADFARDTDLDLLEAWRAGNVRAGDALVNRHWASLSRFVTGKLGDDGADVLSQVFLACVEGVERVDNLKPYLFAVARRRIADHFRKRARTPALDLARSSLVDLGTGPATQLGRAQRREMLREGLARIPLDDQIALELAYFEELSTRELAGVLEIPENTVRSRLSRAREKLRAALAELGTPEEAALAESQLGDRSP